MRIVARSREDRQVRNRRVASCPRQRSVLQWAVAREPLSSAVSRRACAFLCRRRCEDLMKRCRRCPPAATFQIRKPGLRGDVTGAYRYILPIVFSMHGGCDCPRPTDRSPPPARQCDHWQLRNAGPGLRNCGSDRRSSSLQCEGRPAARRAQTTSPTTPGRGRELAIETVPGLRGTTGPRTGYRPWRRSRMGNRADRALKQGLAESAEKSTRLAPIPGRMQMILLRGCGGIAAAAAWHIAPTTTAPEGVSPSSVIRAAAFVKPAS